MNSSQINYNSHSFVFNEEANIVSIVYTFGKFQKYSRLQLKTRYFPLKLLG